MKDTKTLIGARGARSLLAMAFAMAAGAAFCGVFDDALLWMRGPVDVNGDGWIKTTKNNVTTKDLPDALKAGESSAATHTWEGLGPYTNIHVIADGEVGIPYANVTARASYLHFDQPSWVEGDTTNALGGCIRTTALPPMTNADPHSVFIRFRVDSFLSQSEPAVLCSLGHAAGAHGKQGGWPLQLVPDGEGSFWFKIVQGRTQGSTAQWGTGTCELKGAYSNTLTKLATNQWIDVVFSCVLTRISVYSCGEGGLFHAQSNGMGWYSASQVSYSSTYAFGNSGAYYNEPSTNGLKQFRGDIAQIAYWDRLLDESEAREAMAWPRNDRWRLGVKDGTSSEFAGTAGTTVDASAVNSFAHVPASLSAGESFSVTFDMNATNTCGRTQALRVKTTASSAGRATFAATVNGRKTLHFSVAAGGEGVVVFPAKAFNDGANTLEISCESLSGGSAACFDSLALGGAWIVGLPDDSSAEFAYTTTPGIRTKVAALHAEDVDWKRTVINLSPNDRWATNTINALVDASLADLRDSRFVMRSRVNVPKGATGGPMRTELLVNGVSAGSRTFDVGSTFMNGVWPILAGTLRDGTNAFTVINRCIDDGYEPDGAYLLFDCLYFEYEPDPSGTAMRLR